MPLVDHAHRLREGKQHIRLCAAPVFEQVKGGPKEDYKRFDSTRDAANSVLPFVFDVVAPLVNPRRPH